MKIVLTLACCIIVAAATSTPFKPIIKVGSWNLQRLGLNKLSDSKSMDIIFKTISRFDIIAILEIVDSSGEAMKDLLKRLNELNKNDPYELTISERLGRTVYKEQYAFLSKPSVVTVKDTYQYVEPGEDVFQFEPFIVTFYGKFDKLRYFAMAPIHTKPDDAEKEISALADVYDKFREDTGLRDMMILGDFNAGCTYVTSQEWQHIKLFTEKRFNWLLTDHTDTTTKSTTCPYDRIVVIGDKLRRAIQPDSAKPFYYDDYYGTDYELTIDISDHYPVEVGLKYDEDIDSSSINLIQKLQIDELNPSDGLAQLVAAAQKSDKDSNGRTLKIDQKVMVAAWKGKGTTNVIDGLRDFTEDYPEVISERSIQVMEYKLKNQSEERKHQVSVECDREKGTCSMLVAWEAHLY